MRIRKTMVWGFLWVASVAVAGAQQINAAGATFPMPIYQKWFQDYHAQHSSVQINYGGGGSGAGISQLTNGTVDFGASDIPMKDAQIAAMKVKPLHFPTVMGAVVLTYNIPGVAAELKFAPEVIVDIFMGNIKKWNDPKLAKDNPGVKLPAEEIIPVHRADASGTTFVFADYLSKVSSAWKSKVGADSKVAWPVEGLNGNGNPGVAGLVKQTPNSIGYVELIYAIQNKMSYGLVKNSAGEWIKPSLEGVTEAAAGAAKSMPDDFRVSITNAPGKNAYPISTFTWMLIPSQFPDAAKGKVMVEFLKWMLTDGQKQASNLAYAPLPKSVVDKEVKQIAQIKFGK
ncbi:MAG TPA: phosphate ABC transporter substrate-binding protein PstS [Candidatus Acidoferrales bacterium]|nr:phosphate ABC transporter substrate-binding protein PstS [Candidatus Acidoferrales bacterium]